jgi:hypothetical protein
MSEIIWIDGRKSEKKYDSLKAMVQTIAKREDAVALSKDHPDYEQRKKAMATALGVTPAFIDKGALCVDTAKAHCFVLEDMPGGKWRGVLFITVTNTSAFQNSKERLLTYLQVLNC